MLQKEKSATTYSKSNTSKKTPPKNLQTSVQFVKGVGPGLGAVFKSKGIATVEDLLYFFPRTYEDRSHFTEAKAIQEGSPCSVSVTVVSKRHIPLRNRRPLFAVECADESGTVNLKFFHSTKYMETQFRVGRSLIVTGTPKVYRNTPEFVHPEVNWKSSAATDQHVGRIVPVYREIEGVSSRILRKVLWNALEAYDSLLKDELPRELLEYHQLPDRKLAVRSLHYPPPESNLDDLAAFRTPFHQRLIYDEFFKFQMILSRQKKRSETAQGIRLNKIPEHIAIYQKQLPFELTNAQKETIKQISNDLSTDRPMNRLVQGDVGSGKTAVAFLAAAAAMQEGYQVALMAPTEILAEQHFKNALKLLPKREFAILLLTGKTKASVRSEMLPQIAQGKPLLLIGTHALIEDEVKFGRLGMVMIDEQHRFGVLQRQKLREKSQRAPHCLYLTATPIPRTLALTAYGELAVSTIRELPPGRQPIATRVVTDGTRESAYQFIRQRLSEGRQAYFIYPLIETSEAEGFSHLKSAMESAKQLSEDAFRDFRVGLLHGRLSSDEKSEIMESFKKGDLDVLVSTTVVEVGVDVPNSTIIVIEHADRFGLSQLHQLRGRVGRGEHKSYCFLSTHRKKSEVAELRLDALEKTNDGFKIAEIDLEIRGPGEFLGTRQSGALPFKIAHLVRDQEWLEKARKDVEGLLETDPELNSAKNSGLRRFFDSEGKTLELGFTA